MSFGEERRMSRSNEAVEEFRQLLPNDGGKFVLRDAVAAMEKFGATNELTDTHEGPEEHDLIVVAGRFGSKANRRIEIGLYYSFGWFNRLEVLLTYEIGWRNLFLRSYLRHCESRSQVTHFFSGLRKSAWYHRYAQVNGATCSVDWRGPEGMVALYNDVLPVIAKSMGLNSGCTGAVDTPHEPM